MLQIVQLFNRILILKRICPQIRKEYPKRNESPFPKKNVLPGARRMLQRKAIYNIYQKLMKLIRPDENFNWKNIRYTKDKVEKDEMIAGLKHASKTISLRELMMTASNWSKLGVRVLPNGKLCFAGKKLRGIIMPKTRGKQISVVRSFLVWYSPCIDVADDYYKLKDGCFARREDRFLKVFLNVLTHYWPRLLKHLFYFM